MIDKWITQDFTQGQLNALVKNLGGVEVAMKILRGEVEVTLGEAIRVLFNKNGRRIPPQGLKARVCDPDKNFYLEQPRMETEADFAKRLERLCRWVGIETGISAKQFKTEAEVQMELIHGNSQTANLLNGVCLPIILPQVAATSNLGEIIEEFMKPVETSYANAFPDRKFINYRKGELAKQVSIAEGSRHNELVEKMKQGSFVALYFPNPLQGFSVEAQREQAGTLPENFALSGLDTIIAMIIYPDILARDGHTPGYDLAAFSWQSAEYSLCFGASDDWLVFGSEAYLAAAAGYCSGGLVFFG